MPQDIDVVFTPGVAFDKHGGRLGNGKGYYDTFFHKIDSSRIALNMPPSIKLGLSLNEQILHDKEFVPMEPHDVRLDGVIYPDAGLVRALAR